MPQSETNDFGTSVPVRDMALPKHFSGKTPKVNLEETVRKMDKYATVVFKVISRSRAVRASVSIRWDGGRTQSWEMQEIACYDQKQAYDYIATVALFAVSSTAVNKQLPLLFRDLWDELVLKKKEEDDELYRQQLKIFKAIAEPRLQPPPSRVSSTRRQVLCGSLTRTIEQDPRATKSQATATVDESGPRLRPEPSPEVQQRIQEELAIRQAWPSYQEMLVRARVCCSSLPANADPRSFSASTCFASHRRLPLAHHEHYRRQPVCRALRRDWLVSTILSARLQTF